MNKSELMQDLNNKYYRISLRKIPITTYGSNLKYYFVLVFDKDGDVIKQKELHFYVEDEGEANEVAHWDKAEPKLTPIITFNDEVSDYIQVKIDAGKIEGAFMDNIDNVKEIVYGKVIVDVSGNLVEKVIFVDKDASGNLRHRVIE